jgi:hypothetical protein
VIVVENAAIRSPIPCSFRFRFATAAE